MKPKYDNCSMCIRYELYRLYLYLSLTVYCVYFIDFDVTPFELAVARTHILVECCIFFFVGM